MRQRRCSAAAAGLAVLFLFSGCNTGINPLGVPDSDIYSPPPGQGSLTTNLDNQSRINNLVSALATLQPGNTVSTSSSGGVYVGPLGSSLAPDVGDSDIPNYIPPSNTTIPSNSDFDDGDGSNGGSPTIGDTLPPPGQVQGQLRGGPNHYGAVLSATTFESLDGRGPFSVPGYFKAISVELSSSGALVALSIPGWIGVPAPWIPAQVGQPTTLSGSDWGNYTFVVTVDQATQNGATIDVQLHFTLNIEQGNGRFNGDGTHHATIVVGESSLNYSSQTSYDMFMGATGLEQIFDTNQTFEISGTLSPL